MTVDDDEAVPPGNKKQVFIQDIFVLRCLVLILSKIYPFLQFISDYFLKIIKHLKQFVCFLVRRDGFERRDSIDMPSLDEEEPDETVSESRFYRQEF